MAGTAGHDRPSFPENSVAELSIAQRWLVATFFGVGMWYLAWRPTSFNPESIVFSALVYGAELFGYVCAVVYIIMCWRLKRRSALPVPPGMRADVFIPTINEPVEMLRRTLLSARRMAHCEQVWLLDDGNRAEMQALAKSLGCRYLARTDNSHAKAGNLNHALTQVDAEFIAIFDADHAPAAGFLAETLGFFADPKIAFVQTPQDFYNLDSFQHRVDRRHSLVWSEQTLFFRVIQAGKDRMNAAFFCGSCAVIRRAALQDIGGFATGTVTEDIHTALKLHKRGWRSAYYARALAFGLAPATLVPFLKQRLRWGQGAMQVWRREGIVFARGLSAGQKVSYMATMLAYFEGWQRAIFLLSPVIVLTTSVMPIAQMNLEFLLHFVPYYILNLWVFEEMSRGYGRLLLTEQYNLIRFAVFIAATFGWFLQKLRFVVTPKGMGERDATRRMLWPQYLVLALNALAVPIGLALFASGHGLPAGALAANIIWASLALGVCGSALRYAFSVSTSRRSEYRFPVPVPARIAGRHGGQLGLAMDISPGGFRLTGAAASIALPGDELRGELLLPSAAIPIRATVRELSRSPDTAPAVSCQLHWDSEQDRNLLEEFLFGSDLQWRLNGLHERIRPPLEWLSDRLAGRKRPRLLAREWLPVIYTNPATADAEQVGFISPAGPGERTVVALTNLSSDNSFQAQEVTPAGPRTVSGSIAAPEQLAGDGDPIYVYRLSA